MIDQKKCQIVGKKRQISRTEWPDWHLGWRHIEKRRETDNFFFGKKAFFGLSATLEKRIESGGRKLIPIRLGKVAAPASFFCSNREGCPSLRHLGNNPQDLMFSLKNFWVSRQKSLILGIARKFNLESLLPLLKKNFIVFIMLLEKKCENIISLVSGV